MTLLSIVLVVLEARLGRGGLAFLQIREQSVDDVVELFLGESTLKRLAERKRHFRRVVVTVAVVVARGHADAVGGVNDRGGHGLFMDRDGGGEVMWFGSEGTVLFRFLTAFGCPQRREPADERGEGGVNLAARLGGGRFRKREESLGEGLRGHDGMSPDVVGN